MWDAFRAQAGTEQQQRSCSVWQHNFEETIHRAELGCVVCLGPALPFTVIAPCGHVLCKACMDKISQDPDEDRNRCPSCRGDIIMSAVVAALADMVEEFTEYRCLRDGCDFKGKTKVSKDHVCDKKLPDNHICPCTCETTSIDSDVLHRHVQELLFANHHRNLADVQQVFNRFSSARGGPAVFDPHDDNPYRSPPTVADFGDLPPRGVPPAGYFRDSIPPQRANNPYQTVHRMQQAPPDDSWAALTAIERTELLIQQALSMRRSIEERRTESSFGRFHDDGDDDDDRSFRGQQQHRHHHHHHHQLSWENLPIPSRVHQHHHQHHRVQQQPQPQYFMPQEVRQYAATSTSRFQQHPLGGSGHRYVIVSGQQVLLAQLADNEARRFLVANPQRARSWCQRRWVPGHDVSSCTYAHSIDEIQAGRQSMQIPQLPVYQNW